MEVTAKSYSWLLFLLLFIKSCQLFFKIYSEFQTLKDFFKHHNYFD